MRGTRGRTDMETTFSPVCAMAALQAVAPGLLTKMLIDTRTPAARELVLLCQAEAPEPTRETGQTPEMDSWVPEEDFSELTALLDMGAITFGEDCDAGLAVFRAYTRQNPFPAADERPGLVAAFHTEQTGVRAETGRPAFADESMTMIRDMWLADVCAAAYRNAEDMCRLEGIGAAVRELGLEIAAHLGLPPDDADACVEDLLEELLILFKLLVPAYRSPSTCARYWAGHAISEVWAGAGFALDIDEAASRMAPL